MASELVTDVTQLAVIDGVRLDSAANVLVGEHVAKLPFGRSRGRLYVLVEPLGDRTGWEGLCREIAQIIHDEYYESSGSVTAGLRRALEQANSFLCDVNAAEGRRSPRLAGVSAVVLKGNDVFIGQTGPALVYIVSGDSATRFPEDSPWLDMSPRQAMEQGYAPPLGLRPELSVDLFHSQVVPGDRIVLTESALSDVVRPDEAAMVLSGEGGQVVDLRLQNAVADRDLSIVAITVSSPETEDGTGSSRRVQRLGPLSGAPEPGNGRSYTLHVSEADEPSGLKGVLRKIGEAAALGGAYASDVGRVIWRRMLPGSERARMARERRRRVAGATLAPQRRRAPADDRLILVGMLVGLAAVSLIVYALFQWQRGRVLSARYQKALVAAQEKLAEARSASGPELARQALNEADILLDRAVELQVPGHEEDTERLAQQLAEQLDEIDRVVRLYWVPTLRQYTEPGASPEAVIVHGIDIYVLDKGLDRVYKYLFNPLKDGLQELGENVPEILLRAGDERDGLTVGDLVDMTWMPPGPGREWGSLLVLEESGALLEYEPSAGLKVLPVGRRGDLVEPRMIAGVEGRLLVLDASANQILVYEPGSGGYEGEGIPYTNADLLLQGAVDMAVDGDVYLLYADGLVARLRGGQQLEFDLTGLETRMSNPTAMCVSHALEDGSNPGYIYIADSGNQRVLQFTKDGQFVRQFKPKRGDDSFADITGLYVDEEDGKMLVISNDRLLLANLPR